MVSTSDNRGRRQGDRERRRHAARALRAVAGRMSWGLGDQAVSSLTNFAVGAYIESPQVKGQ